MSNAQNNGGATQPNGPQNAGKPDDAPKPNAEQQNQATEGEGQPNATQNAGKPNDTPKPNAEQQNQAAEGEGQPNTPQNAGQVNDRATEGQRFINAFGDQRGPKYFAQGLTYEQAMEQNNKDLQAENSALNQRLNALDRGGEAVDFQNNETPSSQPEKRKGMASCVRINRSK